MKTLLLFQYFLFGTLMLIWGQSPDEGILLKKYSPPLLADVKQQNIEQDTILISLLEDDSIIIEDHITDLNRLEKQIRERYLSEAPNVIILLRCSSRAKYLTYKEIYDNIRAVIMTAREAYSQKNYATSYDELNAHQLIIVKKIYPMSILEGEIPD